MILTKGKASLVGSRVGKLYVTPMWRDRPPTSQTLNQLNAVIASDFELFFLLFLSFIYSSYTYPSIILHTFHPEVKPEHEITLVMKDEYRRSTTSPRRYTSPFPTRLPLSRRIYPRSLSTAQSFDEDEEPRPELDSELPRSPLLQRRQGPRHDLPISIG